MLGCSVSIACRATSIMLWIGRGHVASLSRQKHHIKFHGAGL